MEFKSTLRYDLKEKKINKLLKKVVLKSIAAFNNSDGGLLLIGVDDAGKILGLKADYRTLKKPDKDGFELHLRSLISRSYGEHFVLQQIEIYFPCLAKEEVCVLKINKGRHPLYTSVVDKNGGSKREKFYIRLGNSSQAIDKPSDIIVYQKEQRGRTPRWGVSGCETPRAQIPRSRSPGGRRWRSLQDALAGGRAHGGRVVEDPRDGLVGHPGPPGHVDHAGAPAPLLTHCATLRRRPTPYSPTG